VPFDVVPGVSSAIAAPGLAGIPVTHRGLSAAFLVVSGHDEQAFRSAVGGLHPNAATLVVLMGAARCEANARVLVEHGWLPDTPVAVVTSASASDQQTWRGTLGQLSDGSYGSNDSDGPTTIVVGSVVALMAGSAAEVERTYVTGT
jgi:uroporphyrin-III C-methyltransferase/precorrin-2 dehydrogenase/sirohydrochlorin ferrochelatase